MTTSDMEMGEAQKGRDLSHDGSDERIHFDGIQSQGAASPQFRMALHLVSCGMPILRPTGGTNVPNQREWPSKATTDPIVLATPNAEQPNANWGVLTGKGLGVFDLDAKSDP